ncbi:hypothetical protein [Paenibacillus elgii]|uniref:hypothetical protein n=1 Tax=Paenibacillus elgii TaxID=189691 RepID=UPI001F35CC1B|nr:hypothetical protein [Paenibacillus elgii]
MHDTGNASGQRFVHSEHIVQMLQGGKRKRIRIELWLGPSQQSGIVPLDAEPA